MRRFIAMIVAVLAATGPSAAQIAVNTTRAATDRAQRPGPGNVAKKKRETPAEWLHRVTGIDLRAYSNMTAVRQENGIDPAPLLMRFDDRTGIETVVWKCGDCWSPARADGGTVVLRQAPDDPSGAELWLIRDGAAEPTRITVIPRAAAIAGTSHGRIYIGVMRDRCISSREGPYGIVSVDLGNGSVAEASDSPCFGTVSLVATGRVRGDRYLATTRRNDLSGNPRPRQLLVMAPAKGEMPTARLFDERLHAPPDRYDAVWIDEHQVVYLAKP